MRYTGNKQSFKGYVYEQLSAPSIYFCVQAEQVKYAPKTTLNKP